MAIKLSTKITLPADAVTDTFAILGQRGSGKTYTAGVMAEGLLGSKAQVATNI